MSIAIFTFHQNTIILLPLIILTYPLKPLLLLMGDAVVVAEFSVDNVKSVMRMKIKIKIVRCANMAWKYLDGMKHNIVI